MGFFKKLNKGLKKTRDNMSGAINAALYGKNEIDDEFYDELEEILVMADVGVNTSAEIVEKLRDAVFKKNLRKAKDVKEEIKNIVADMLSGGETIDMVTIPSVILVIGVNGVGKTTSIGKMAAMFKEEGKKVILGAADTFRAAAIDQLEIWADRAGVDIVKHKEGADPAAVVFGSFHGVAMTMVSISGCSRVISQEKVLPSWNFLKLQSRRRLPSDTLNSISRRLS